MTEDTDIPCLSVKSAKSIYFSDRPIRPILSPLRRKKFEMKSTANNSFDGRPQSTPLRENRLPAFSSGLLHSSCAQRQTVCVVKNSKNESFPAEAQQKQTSRESDPACEISFSESDNEFRYPVALLEQIVCKRLSNIHCRQDVDNRSLSISQKKMGTSSSCLETKGKSQLVRTNIHKWAPVDEWKTDGVL